MTRKGQEDKEPEVETEALSEEARASVEKSLAAERKEAAPKGEVNSGLPKQTDFVTPRESQDEETV